MASHTRWEIASVKAQLRLTCLRLGQLQEKKDSQGTIIRRDIATLLQQRNVVLARAKAQRLVQEDALGDLLEILEMHVGLLLEHLGEIDQSVSPSPNMVEAASTIIFAAPHVESKDLEAVSDILALRLGADFAYSALRNSDNHVAANVVEAISSPSPSANALDACLQKIANDYNVQWSPEPRREDIINALSEILDPQASPVVDLPRLRRLCCRGIPDEPSWLRPRIWKLFFGVLPILKASWKNEIQKQRESYYDLIYRLVEPVSSLPPPSTPLTPRDALLLDISKQLSSIPFTLFSNLLDSPEHAKLCPLDDSATDEIKITSARNLDVRLRLLQERNQKASSVSKMPGIQVQTNGTPEISLSSPTTGVFGGPTTLLPFRSCSNIGDADQRHSSALLRLLYLHTSINPGNLSPNMPSLLVPLYTVLNQEIEPDELAHVEADTFWLFEAMVGEFSELEDEEVGSVWMKKLSERLAWADDELSNSLQVKGLDPALPHYSYRWTAPLLTHTLPLSFVFIVWDALFSFPARERDTNPKIDHLLNICVAMLVRARAALFRLGKNGRKSPSLWTEENSALPPPSPLRAWELGDAFVEGMSLLQLYPLEAAGGIDRILQTASDLATRREEEKSLAQNDKPGLGARLKVTMWKGFTNQTISPDISPEESEEEVLDETSPHNDSDNETDKDQSPGLTSRLAASVWRGITNQTSMEVPPSPMALSTPSSPSPLGRGSTSFNEDAIPEIVPSSSTSLWGYAEKIKESDTAATIAKVSSNWRAKALGSWGRSTVTSSEIGSPVPLRAAARSESISEGYNKRTEENRRGSLPPIDRSGIYSPPPRPHYFRPPRDSFIFPGVATISSSILEQPAQNDSTLVEKTRSLQSSLASLTRGQTAQPVTRSVPRPLLLNPSTSITSPPSRPISRSNSAAVSDPGDWADVMKLKSHSLHRDSQSSISSLSPSDAMRVVKSGKTDWDSDTGGSSRLVPLNRRSVSPMAPGFRVHHGRPMSGSSSATSSDRGLLSPPLSNLSEGWSRVEVPESPPRASSPPTKPPNDLQLRPESIIHANNASLMIDNSFEVSVLTNDKQVRNGTTSPSNGQPDDTSDSSLNLNASKNPRLRSKRYMARPPNLDIHDSATRQREHKSSNLNSLTVEWPNDDQDVASTPRAADFTPDDISSNSPSKSLRRSRKVSTEGHERLRKPSTEGHEVRPRKVSSGQRTRKTSSDNKDVVKRTRDSSADEGDDEGYDDLLSAYESEESAEISALR